jgi:protease-4
MANTHTGTSAPTSQTIVLDRRGGCLRWSLLPILFISLMLNCAYFGSVGGMLPHRLTESYYAGALEAKSKIAIVEVSGVIVDASAEHAIKQLKQARDDDAVKAIVLRVDSPGGTVTGSDRIWREVELLVKGTDKKGTKRKPVIVSMGGTAASGGYYVSAPADVIYAEPTTMTGSIGVILEVPQLHKLMEKVGIDFATITTGEYKDMGSMFRPMTPKEEARWRETIDAVYQRFVRIVAEGRKLELSKTLDLANGKVYTSKEALDLKLVDHLGYLDDAIEEAQRRAKLNEMRVIKYARPMGLQEIFSDLSGSSKSWKLDQETMMTLSVPQMLLLAR